MFNTKLKEMQLLTLQKKQQLLEDEIRQLSKEIDKEANKNQD